MTRPVATIVIGEPELVGDIFDDASLARLERTVRLDGVRSDGDADGIEDAEIAITGWGAPRFDAARLERWPHLRAVVHAAGSVKRVVSPELWERGIRVSSGAAANALPVAEYTVSMILLSAKDALGSARTYARTQDMTAARPGRDVGAYGITVGIVGASRIGRRVMELLRPFDVSLLVYDPSLSADDAAALNATRMSLPDLMRASDIVSLHAPSLPETHRMVDAAQLALLRDGATLINTARGRLVDTDALVSELDAGRLRAVLDVTDPEPLPPGHPLFSTPGTTLTPHIAGSLGNELRRIGRQVVDEVENFVTRGDLSHEVTHGDLVRIA